MPTLGSRWRFESWLRWGLAPLGSGLAFASSPTYAPSLSRSLRIEFPGAVYHVTSRGDRREPIYRDDDDRLEHLDVIAQAMDRFDAQLLAPLMQVPASEALYHRALDVQARWRFGFYDSLVVAGALSAGCTDAVQ